MTHIATITHGVNIYRYPIDSNPDSVGRAAEQVSRVNSRLVIFPLRVLPPIGAVSKAVYSAALSDFMMF